MGEIRKSSRRKDDRDDGYRSGRARPTRRRADDDEIDDDRDTPSEKTKKSNAVLIWSCVGGGALLLGVIALVAVLMWPKKESESQVANGAVQQHPESTEGQLKPTEQTPAESATVTHGKTQEQLFAESIGQVPRAKDPGTLPPAGNTGGVNPGVPFGGMNPGMTPGFPGNGSPMNMPNLNDPNVKKAMDDAKKMLDQMGKNPGFPPPGGEAGLLAKQDIVLQATDEADLKRPGSHCKKVTLFLPSSLLVVHLKKTPGSAVDPYLRVEDLSGKVLFEDDNSGGGQDAHITFSPPAPGQYTIVATTAGPNQLGQVALRIIDHTQPGVGPAPPLTPPANTTGIPPSQNPATGAPKVIVQNWMIQNNDVADIHRKGSRCKVTPVGFEAGKSYTIEMKQTAGSAVDPYLRLEDPTGKIIIEDDNSGGGRNARLNYKPTQTLQCLLITTTAGANQFGPFQLVITESGASLAGGVNPGTVQGARPDAGAGKIVFQTKGTVGPNDETSAGLTNSKNKHHFKRYLIPFTPGKTYVADLKIPAGSQLSPHLLFQDAQGKTLASKTGGNPLRIQHVAAQKDGNLWLVCSNAVVNQYGAFEVTVTEIADSNFVAPNHAPQISPSFPGNNGANIQGEYHGTIIRINGRAITVKTGTNRGNATEVTLTVAGNVQVFTGTWNDATRTATAGALLDRGFDNPSIQSANTSPVRGVFTTDPTSKQVTKIVVTKFGF